MLQGWANISLKVTKIRRWNRIICCSQETLSDKDSDDELDPVPNEKTDNEMLFVYQSKDMQRLY